MHRERVDYFDIAKGILIVIVILGHALLYVGNAGITHYGHNMFSAVYSCFMVFYMQAFFLINGLTTNFNYSFSEFSKKKFLTLMIPCLVFSLLINVCDGQYPFSMELLHILAKHGGRGTYMWFLPALFLANMIFWFFNRCVKGDCMKCLGVVALAAVGVGLNDTFPSKNIWYLSHALTLLPFLYVGNVMKMYNLSSNKYLEISGLVIYTSIMIIGTICGIQFPYLCLGYNVSICTLPLHLVLATSGTLTILALSRKIGYSNVLQTLGRGSLVIYMTHIVVICGLLSLTSEYWRNVNSGLIGGLLFVVLLIVSTLISYGLNLLFDQRYLRILLGRV